MAGEAFINCTVGELAAQTRNALVGGPFGSDLVSKDYVPSGVPVIRGTNMGHGRWVDGEFAYVTPEKAEALSSNCAKPGDIVFTQRGTLGQVALLPKKGAEKYLISQSQMKLTVDAEKADAVFLYYLFTSAEQQDYIRQNAIQTGVPHTNLGILRNTPLALPPLVEQKAIAAVLGALDDKIELNRRMNAKLEEMARALFQSWFVDFDPVRAKLDGREPVGLDPGTALLFPDNLEDSPLGHIPQGWKAGTLSEGFNLTMGQSPPGYTYNEEGNGLPFYQGRTDFGFRFPTRRIYCTAPTRYAKPGDTLVSVRAPVGDINMAKEDCCIGRGVAAVKHRTGAISFTYYSMASLAAEFARFEAEGTVFGAINKDSFEKLCFVIPPDEVVAAYEEKVSPLDNEIRIHEVQTRTLAAIRDMMLPKLLNGELSTAMAACLSSQAVLQ